VGIQDVDILPSDAGSRQRASNCITMLAGYCIEVGFMHVHLTLPCGVDLGYVERCGGNSDI